MIKWLVSFDLKVIESHKLAILCPLMVGGQTWLS